MKKNVLSLLCALALLCLAGCATRTNNETPLTIDGTAEQNSADAETMETVSVNPKDYVITDAMLSGEESANVSQLSLEALGAYFLHTDEAMAESSGDELYQRFMRDPDAVLSYLAKLGDQTARGNDTAATELCREIASADVFWYDATPEFSAILKECQERHASGQISELVKCLRVEYDAALERNPN